MDFGTLQMMLKSKAQKNKELSLLTLVTILSQFMVGQNQNKNISDEVAKVKEEFHQLRVEHERLFVRKDELNHLGDKMDDMREDIGKLNARVADIQGVLKHSRRFQSASYTDNYYLLTQWRMKF